MRRRRAEISSAPVFADPCWDMLLDLFVQTTNGVNVSVSSACLASGVACTTALGHVIKLEREGLVVRTADDRDRRRTFLRLTPGAASAIRQWLAETFVA